MVLHRIPQEPQGRSKGFQEVPWEFQRVSGAFKEPSGGAREFLGDFRGSQGRFKEPQGRTRESKRGSKRSQRRFGRPPRNPTGVLRGSFRTLPQNSITPNECLDFRLATVTTVIFQSDGGEELAPR